jgi:signal transduction histidine kinase
MSRMTFAATPSAGDTSVEALRLEGYLEHYGAMRLLRLIIPAGVVGILATVASPAYTATFAIIHYGLYGLFYGALWLARRDIRPSRALRVATWGTGVSTFLISSHMCLMALHMFATGVGVVRTEAGLLIIGVMIFCALQVHMTRWGYLAAIASPIAALLWTATLGRSNSGGHLGVAVAVFMVSIVAATWRQQSTDRSLSEARLALMGKNAALTRLVEEAEAARAAAEAANRAKSDFLAMTSHEIRTPLNAVLGLAEALKRDGLKPNQLELTQGVLDAGALLKRLLNAVLDISKIEAGKMTVDAAPFDLSRLARTVVRLWIPRAREQGVTLVLDESALPEHCALEADAGKIEQTLVNLISNAIKFTPPGKTVTVSLAARAAGGRVFVEARVIDQGPGVAAADHARIFKAFEQTDLGRASGGAGLGLAICAGNVALMGGELSVEDAPDRGDGVVGACFRFSFDAPSAVAPEESETNAADPSLNAERPLRVLAAEDNAANRHVLKALLGPLPVDLTLTENGLQALDALQTASFDIVLMDANMPVMDGLTALRAIRSGGGITAETPVWMLTANVFDEDVARYRAAGADGVIRKPIDLKELFGALAQAGVRAQMIEDAAAA